MCRFRAHLATENLSRTEPVHGDLNAFSGPDVAKQYPPDLVIEPVHLEINLTLDIAQESAKGVVVTTVKGIAAGGRQLVLDAVDFTDLKVKDPSGKKVTYQYDGKKLRLVWADAFAAGELRKVEIAYQVTHPVSGLFLMQPTADEPGKPTYAHTDHETERARHWLPCVDLPSVRTTLDLKLTVPEGLTVLGNGLCLGEKKLAGGLKTVHWHLEQRCPSYLICFAVGDFVRFDDGAVNGIELSYFTSKDFTPEDLKRAFGRTGKMLAWMTKRLGMKYPFPKYYQFALPTIGGAMENISLVSWNDIFVLDEAHAREWTWVVDQTNIHEMAHSYFGDLVVCRDFAHAWLKESWATYMEQCWLEDEYGDDELRHDLYRNAEAYFTESEESYARPIVTREFKSSWQMYDRHLYPGGACRLHTLRKEIGDAAFWAGVTDYLQTFQNQTVETEDFRRMMEKHSGRSLVKFFEQWFYRAGFPDFKVTFTHDPVKKLGTFIIEQKQVGSDKNKVPFELTTDVGWTIGGKSFTQEVKIAYARHEVMIPMAAEPQQVRFDPLGRALHRLEFDPGQDMLMAQLTQAIDVPGRIHAATELCKSGKRAAITAVMEAYFKEKFWGVRRAMAKALSRAGVDGAVAGLARIVNEEKDPLVLEGAFHYAGEYRDPRILSALLARMKDKLPPVVKSHLLQSIGAQRQDAPLEILAAATKDTDKYGFVPSAAMRAMAATRREEVAHVLLEGASPGKMPFRARPGAVAGLGSLAMYLEKRDRVLVVEKLQDLLRDQDATVRMTAVKALRSAEAKEAVDALEAFRGTVSAQEQVEVERVIRALKKTEVESVVALQKQLEELHERYRKLDERVQKMEA